MNGSVDCALVEKICSSPNFNMRVGARKPDMLVLHYTDMPTCGDALDRLVCPEAAVSSHYLVDHDGCIHQLVREDDRAWHAGVSFWAGETDLNSCSIGVEVVNTGHRAGYPDFSDVQMRAVSALCRDIVKRRHIPASRVLAHSDIAPSRKIDPGEKFDWQSLARDGVGLWPAPVSVSDAPLVGSAMRGDAVLEIQKKLSFIGYDVDVNGFFDRKTELVVAAFQRHFRPSLIDGRVDSGTRSTLAAVARAVIMSRADMCD